MAEGLSNREIAGRLNLSLETIKWYNRQLYGKLGVSNRSQAVARASKLGMLDPAAATSAPISIPARHNLPAQLSSFVGRGQEIAAVQTLLTGSRLVTLTGAGGTGKTRLALQVAAQSLAHYPDGVYFVSLAAIRDSRMVPTAIARSLDVAERPQRPLVGTLSQYLTDKQLLLVLDNCEHLLPAAPLVAALLRAAPGLAVLATSREALRLSGEHEYVVPPLTLPDPAQPDLSADESLSEAMALFVQRARAAAADFHLTEENAAAVAAICIRLDGLPLAIELAAARIKMLSPLQLLARLEVRLGWLARGARDMPARQRTLRDTMDWSYNLLRPEEQRLFARLGVFVGSRSLEAIQAVCTHDLSLDALDGVASLLNKSLLVQIEGPAQEKRYVMLATIQEYALERLLASGDLRRLRDRHLQYFLSLAEHREPGYRRHNQLLLLDRTEAEMGDLRAAVAWAHESGQREAAARLVAATDYFLYYRDHFVEGYRWIQRLLPAIDQFAPRHRLRFLLAAEMLAWANGAFADGQLFSEEAQLLAMELGHPRAHAMALLGLTRSAVDQADRWTEAMRQGEEALAILRQLDDEPGLAYAYNAMGELARFGGDYDRARQLYEASLSISIKTGEIIRQIINEQNLGFVAYQEGAYEQACRLFISYTRRLVPLGNRQSVVAGLACLAGPLCELGEAEKAARLLGASAALLARMGAEYHPSDWLEIEAFTAATRSALPEAVFAAAWAEGAGMTLDEAVAYALPSAREPE